MDETEAQEEQTLFLRGENQAEASTDDLTGSGGDLGLLDILHAAEEIGGMFRIRIERTEQHAALFWKWRRPRSGWREPLRRRAQNSKGL
jgi:hypothetical protein